MSSGFYDVIVAKEYTTKQSGRDERRTAWNKVGRAWASQSGEALNVELFLFPNQRYVVQLKSREERVASTAPNKESSESK